MKRQTLLIAFTLLIPCASPICLGAAAPILEIHPPLMPSRDVTVTYVVQPDQNPQAQTVTVSFKAAGRAMRIESGDKKYVTILDRGAKLVTLLMQKKKLYARFTPRNGIWNPFMLDLSMRFTPVGHDVIASVACTRWQIVAPAGKATACVSSDGVILSEDGVDADGASGTLRAKNVTYGPLPESAFEPPSDYQDISKPKNHTFQ